MSGQIAPSASQSVRIHSMLVAVTVPICDQCLLAIFVGGSICYHS